MDLVTSPEPPASLATLPVEIVSRIFEFVTTCDCIGPCDCGPYEILPHALSFRLVSKRCGAIGARNVFKTIHLSFRKKSFENLRNISQDPILRKYVKSIIYEGDALGDMSRARYELCIPLPKAFRLPKDFWFAYSRDRHSFEVAPRARIHDTDTVRARELFREKFDIQALYKEEERNDGFRALKKEISDNKDLAKNSFDYTTLAEALKHFPLLEDIQIMTRLNNHPKHLKTVFKHTLTFPQQTVSQFSLLSGNESTIIRIPQEATECFRQLESILVAAATSGVKLKHLEFGYISWRFFLDSCYLFPTQLPVHPKLCFPAFTHLTSLEMFLCCPKVNTVLWGGHRGKESLLGKAIASARGLRSLSLRFGFGFRDHEFHGRYLRELTDGLVPATWDHIAQGTTWPHLKDLRLSTVAITEDFWVDFVERHSKTLKAIHMDEMIMVKGGKWSSTFDRMKDVVQETKVLKLLTLHRYFLRFLDEDGSERDPIIVDMMAPHSAKSSNRFGSKVAQYIIGKGENPSSLVETNSDYAQAIISFDDQDVDYLDYTLEEERAESENEYYEMTPADWHSDMGDHSDDDNYGDQEAEEDDGAEEEEEEEEIFNDWRPFVLPHNYAPLS